MAKELLHGRVPDGWELVTKGCIQEGDRAWNLVDGKWDDPYKNPLVRIMEPGSNKWDWLSKSRNDPAHSYVYAEAKYWEGLIRKKRRS